MFETINVTIFLCFSFFGPRGCLKLNAVLYSFLFQLGRERQVEEGTKESTVLFSPKKNSDMSKGKENKGRRVENNIAREEEFDDNIYNVILLLRTSVDKDLYRLVHKLSGTR